MKYTALFFTLLSLFAFTSEIDAQIYRLSTTSDGDREVITASFSAPSSAMFVAYEVKPLVSTAAQCFASTDFSSAVPVGADRAAISMEPSTGTGTGTTFFLRNTNSPSLEDSCSVIILRSLSGDARDFILWRARYGSTGLFDQAIETGKENDSATAQRTRVTSLQVTFGA